MDLLYELLMNNVDPEKRADTDEFLALPFGVHPELTPAAKRRRAQQMRKLMGGS